MRMHVRTTIVVVLLLALGACSQPELAADDRRLLDYASRSYDKREMMNTKVSLGVHNGAPVIAEFPCSDICPDYTVRIIHYSLAEGQSCSQVSGVEKSVLVPAGVGRTERSYCFPAILAANWRKYRM
jgi:hypothetical protein